MPSTYPSIYRAQAVQATPTKIKAFVPQIFGDAQIEITDFLGPPTTGMGWVFFQAGDPEHPVWTTRVAGSGEIPDYSEEINDLDTRVESLEGGGELPEVHVGASAPVESTVELWYDTDAPGITPEDLRWQSAWGLVVGAPFWDVAVNNANNVNSYVGTITTPVLTVGRQYVFELTQSASYASIVGETWAWQIQLDGVSQGEHYYQITNTNQYIIPSTLDTYFSVATSGTRVARVAVRRISGTGIMQSRGSFAIRDVGPVAGSPVVPSPATPWTNLSLLNGWIVLGGAEQTPQYRRVGDMVQLRGTMRGGSLGTVAFTLPIGYRPPTLLRPSCCSLSVSVQSAPGRADIGASGDYIPGGGETQYFGIDFEFSVTP